MVDKQKKCMKKIVLLRIFILSLILIQISCSNKSNSSSNDDAKQVKILSYNIRNARGNDDVVDYDRISGVISRIGADCVAIQELDSATERSGGDVVLDEIAKRTNMHATYNKSIDYKGGGYGIGVLTREKPISTKAVPLPGREESRSVLFVELDDYVIGCTHWSLTAEDRLASVAVINELVKVYEDKPVFLGGDFNAFSTSEEMTEIAKNWTITNDVNNFTIPSDNPKRCIDYILVKNNQSFEIETLETAVEDEPDASDHLPVWSVVRFVRADKKR
jgi:endonuclease/exonuclease/phosphatase family metal-dependent hydrolase